MLHNSILYWARHKKNYKDEDNKLNDTNSIDYFTTNSISY